MSARLKTILLLLALAGGVTLPYEAGAERYEDRSGLRQGSFVWTPAVSNDGSLTVVVSLAAGMLHVYRGGEEAGIVPISIMGELPDGTGVGLARMHRSTDAGRFWVSGLLGIGALPGSGARPRVSVPDEFAGLLASASRGGGYLVVARERSTPQTFEAHGPYRTDIATGAIGLVAAEATVATVGNVARFAAPDLSSSLAKMAPATERPPTSADAPPAEMSRRSDGDDTRAAADADERDAEAAVRSGSRAPEVQPSATSALPRLPSVDTAVVVSRADSTAYLIEDGALTRTVPIVIEPQSADLGEHAVVLLQPSQGERPARWVGFGIAGDASAPQVTNEQTRDAFERVRFLDDQGNTAIKTRLKPGSVIILTDEPAGSIATLNEPERAASRIAAIGAQSDRLVEPQDPVYAERTEPGDEPSAGPAAVVEQPAILPAASAAARRRAAVVPRKNAKRPRAGQTAKSPSSSADWSERLFRPY